MVELQLRQEIQQAVEDCADQQRRMFVKENLWKQDIRTLKDTFKNTHRDATDRILDKCPGMARGNGWAMMFQVVSGRLEVLIDMVPRWKR